MFQEIRKIPPAPREVRWRAVLWHRWPVALLGFVFAVYGGVFTLMLYFAAGGKPSDGARLDREATIANAQVTDVRVVDAGDPGVDLVSYRFEDAVGVLRNGQSYAERYLYEMHNRVEVEYLTDEAGINRIVGSRGLNLLPPWVEPSLFLGLLVLPGLLALGLWFQGVFDLKRMMSTGDVAVAEILEIRKQRLVLPSMLAVCYRFRDHRAIPRVGRHWVRARSALGEELSAGPTHMPVLHHRRWPQFSRLALVCDFQGDASTTPAAAGQVRPRA